MKKFAKSKDKIEMILDKADHQAGATEKRISHKTIFNNVRKAINKNNQTPAPSKLD